MGRVRVESGSACCRRLHCDSRAAADAIRSVYAPHVDPENLARLRREYGAAGLSESAAGDDPQPLLVRWLDDAVTAGVVEPNAMALGTVGAEGRPSVRVVLLKGLDEEGLVFFTGYESRKSRDLAVEQWAAATLLWYVIGRQVRVEGPVSRLGARDSDAYFATRPRDSQLAAWASPQSQVVPGRHDLERRLAEVAGRFRDDEKVPRPVGWGGLRLRPQVVEFWQGREGRLHDRLRYRRVDETWERDRLGP